MLCGIKFCGGCNPRYDRVRAFERVKFHFEEAAPKGAKSEKLEFQYAKEGVPYDVLLVIGGCPACCASHLQYDVHGEIVKMWGEDQLPETIERLQELL